MIDCQEMKQREADQLKEERRLQQDPFASSAIRKSLKTRPQSLGVYGDIQVCVYLPKRVESLITNSIWVYGDIKYSVYDPMIVKSQIVKYQTLLFYYSII